MLVFAPKSHSDNEWLKQNHSCSDSFSLVVKNPRKKKMSRAALAELSGLHQTYIGLLERGERSPNLDTAKAMQKL